MTKANFRRTLVGAAVAAALGVMGPADAAPYRGTFDPVDFSGEYEINVAAACLQQGNGWFPNSGICTATLISAFADTVSTSPDPTFNGRLIFAPPIVSSGLFGLYVYGGQIDSFDTALIHHQAGSDPTPDDWWIQFVSGHMPPPCQYPVCIDAAPSFDTTTKGVYLYLNTQDAPIASAQYTSRAVDLAIPEPGTLSLLLGALGGGWLARRRRKEKVPDPN